MLREAGIAI